MRVQLETTTQLNQLKEVNILLLHLLSVLI